MKFYHPFGCGSLNQRAFRISFLNPQCSALAFVCAALVGSLVSARADALSDRVREQIQALRLEKENRTPAQLKMDSQLVYALKQSLHQTIAPGVSNLIVFAKAEADGRVWVDLKATISADLLDFIRGSGGTILNSVPEFQGARVLVPVSSLESLAARSDVVFIRPAWEPERDTGSVDSEGDITESAALARATFRADGSGVKVGVLSDSVDHLAASQASGDIPTNLVVLAGQSGVPGTGEGTAMLEIVADLAPGAQLYFATANGGEANFAKNILSLRSAGCDIIVDDIRYLTEPPLQDGTVARAVNSVTADGALYFASAGNSGNKAHGTSGTWEGDFADGGPAGNPVDGRGGILHSFGANTYDTVTLGGSAALLWWADPLGASTNDYDLYVLDGSGTTVLGASTNPQTGTQDPFEGLVGGFTNGMRIVVVKVSGDARFLHIDSGRGQLAVNTTGFARGHSACTNAFSTAAVNIATSYPQAFVGGARNPVEDFSSDGPRRMFFQQNGTPITPTNFTSTGGAVRQYPTICASDGVTTTVPGFAPFFGTSAAAPHAAAIAALLKSYNSLLSNDQIRSILTSTALDNEAVGLDVTGGYGILMADAALAAAPVPAPVPELVIAGSTISGGNGNGIIEYNECNNLDLVLTNLGLANASSVHVTLTTTTPGVIVAQPNAFFPNIATNAAGTNFAAFRISTAPEFICGVPIELNAEIKCDQSTVNRSLVLPTGIPGLPLRFDNSNPAFIPDVGSTNSVIVVSNVNFALSRIVVSLYITHTFDSDLVLQLISPDGTTNLLAANAGGSGQNYGLACSPDTYRTTFDDLAPDPITTGVPPFLGNFQPTQPLSVFSGKSGTNVNGAWRLLVSDTALFDVGTLQCWSLIVTPTTCTNGGGECPGSDMSIGMRSQPEPALVGNNLTYLLSVTNAGPSRANAASVSQVLPDNVVFVSASSSQGAVVHNSGIVTANLGPMSAGATASMSVVVLPVVAGVASSTATVSSDQPDFSLGNNNATVISHINPPSADLSVGLLAAPTSLTIGGTVTYTLSVTNNGPSSASGIFATNVYPPGISLRSASISQGSLSISGNTVVCSFGGLTHGASATATITATAVATGTLLATANVISTNPNEVDPAPGNNSVSTSISVGPAADLALGLVALPNPDVVTSNLTLVTTITNFGPSPATAVVLNEALPTALTNISISIVPTNSYTLNGTNLTVPFGTLAAGARVTVTITGGTIKQGFLSCVAGVSATEADPDISNNSSTVNVLVALPFVNIVSAGSSMTSPSSGYVDIGQTNTIQFRLQNTGNVPNTNLVVTLMTNAGVTPVSGPQTYGILRPTGVPGGVPISRPFSFVANGSNGGTVSAVLSLQDAGNTNLPPVTFTFLLPLGTTFANTNLITIPDPNNMPTIGSGPATPYPSTITVAGVTGQVSRVTATLVGLTHSYPHDISALLVGPTGAKTLLLSHAAEFSSVSDATVTFDDTAASPLPASGGITSGAWQPSAYPPSPVFSNPAPAGPYTASMATFGGQNPNGTWSLYVYDDGTGDTGNIANGWSINISTVTPVNQVADVGVSGVASANPAFAGDVLTYTFTVTNAGPSGATGVTFSNTLPAGLLLLSATSSQGNAVTNGNTVQANLASVGSGASATVTVTAKATIGALGQITNTASVSAFETDLHSSDNRVSVITAINLPTSSLALSLTPSASSPYVGSNLVYTINVTNNGPGNALNVSISDTLPPNLTYLSATSLPGSASYNAGTVTATMGDLSPNATGIVTINVRAQVAGLVTNTATASTLSSNIPNTSVSAASVVSVSAPGPRIVPAGQGLIFESFSPPNGVVDPGEQVTVSLALANTGVLDTANLVATLLATNGVTLPSGPTNYGHLVHGGAAVSRNFSFTASAAATGSVTAVLQLTDGANDLGTASFVFSLPANSTFVNTNAIVIPDHGPGSPYPSIINVTGLTGYVTKAVVTLSGLTHSFPSDVNVLLVNPAGRNTLLMSHNGGGYSITNVTLTFDDGAATALPNNNARITTGTNRPSMFTPAVTFPSPAPAPPYSAALSALNNASPNGVWALYVLDDSAGDSGVIASGWTLNLSTLNPATPLTDLAGGMTVTPSSVIIGSGNLVYSINVTNLGPSTAPNVQVNDPLPLGCSLVSSAASTGSVSYSAGTVSWSPGDMAVGSTASLTLTVAPSLAGTFLNIATVSGNVTDLNQANNSPQVLAQAVSPPPAILSGAVTNGLFLLTVNAEPGHSYMVQASSDLTSWLSLGIYTATNGTFTVLDNTSPLLRTRYYRTIRQLP